MRLVGPPRYSEHDRNLMKRAVEAALRLAAKTEKGLDTLGLAALIVHGASEKLNALALWVAQDNRTDVPDGCRESGVRALASLYVAIKQVRDAAEKKAASADVLNAFKKDLARVVDLSHTVRGQLALRLEDLVELGDSEQTKESAT